MQGTGGKMWIEFSVRGKRFCLQLTNNILGNSSPSLGSLVVSKNGMLRAGKFFKEVTMLFK